MVELRQLRYLLAIAEEGTITRAAQRLGIQQPPLTRQIRALEDQLGVQLLHRLPRGVELTEAGRVMAEEAQAIIARLELAGEAARRAGRGEKGRIAVGFTGSAGFHPFVPAVIREFRRRWPGILLLLEEGGTAELADSLLRQSVDVAIVRSPTGGSTGLLLEEILAEDMLVALPAGHRLAIRLPDEGIPLSALREETFILYRRPAGPGLYDAIISACTGAGFSPLVGQEAPRMLSTLSLVAAGLGVSIVPASMRRLDPGNVVYVPIAGAPKLSAPLQLASRRADRSTAVRQFRLLVRQLASGAHDSP